ncbi:BACON domain-containing protein [Archangium sp.]|uniref:BACON domain-containing protein n=1 Tax=Archangium sp. TaxID=1872627 RepID=UPI0039C88FD9
MWAVLASLWLAGCTGEPGTRIEVDTHAVTFEAIQGGEAPLPQTVKATYVGAGLLAGYPPEQREPSWLKLAISGGDETSFLFRLTISDTRSLSPGTYETKVRFVTAREDQSDIKFTDVKVTYVLKDPKEQPALVASPTSLEFTAMSGHSELPAARTVTVTDPLQEPVRYFVTVTYYSAGQGWLTAPSQATTPQPLSLRPNGTGLVPGRYLAVVRLTPSNGRPATELTVTYIVQPPPLSVSPGQLSFTASSGQSAPPAAQNVTISSRQPEPIRYSVTARYTMGNIQGWLELPAPGTTPQAIAISPNTTALAPGNYAAIVSLTPDNGLPATEFPVSYSLSTSELQVNPFSPTLQVDSTTTEAQLTVPLAVSSSAAPLDWRVVSTGASWLSTSATAGNTQTAPGLELIVSKSALEELPNGTHSATLTLAFGNAALPERQRMSTFKLTVALPRFRTVMPYATEAGSSLSHIVRGEGFTRLQSGQSLRIGATTTSAYQVVSDTELRLNSPVLAAGAHLFSVPNALGLTLSTATLHAVQTPAFTELSLPHSRGPRRVIYDPLRTAVYSVEAGSGSGTGTVYALYRYRYVNGTWQEELYVSLPDIYDAAMDVDGQSLYLAVRTGLYRLDLNDTSTTPRFLRTLPPYARLEVLNDGKVLSTPDSCPRTVTSLDGRRSLFVDGCGSSPPRAYWYYDASTGGQLGIAPVAGNGAFLALDRTASYAVVGGSAYDAQWNLVANVGSLSGLIFSHDGRRLFGFYGDETQSRQMMHVFDTATPPTGGQFTRLAELVMPGAQTYAGYSTQGFVAPDGRTLIKVDSQRFHVFPIPGSLQ